MSLFKRKTKKREYQDGPGHSHDGGITWHDHDGSFTYHWHENGVYKRHEAPPDPFKKKA